MLQLMLSLRRPSQRQRVVVRGTLLEKVIEYVYSNTNKSALVRKLLVGMYVASGYGNWLFEYGDPANVPPKFLLELASKLLNQDGRRRSKIFEASGYHIHTSNDGKVERKNGSY
jgi:hypothetical protein